MSTNPVPSRSSFGFMLLLTGFCLYLTFLVAQPFITPVIVAILFAVATYPVFQFFFKAVGNRGGAALITTTVVLIALLAPAVLTINALVTEITAFYRDLSTQPAGTASWSEYLGRVAEAPLAWVERKTGVSRDQLRSTAIDRLQVVSVLLLGWSKSLAFNITGTVFNAFITLFTLFFLLRDGPALLLDIGGLLPMDPKRYSSLLKTISDSIIANVYGVFAVAIAQAILGAIGYWIAGLPNIVLWSAMTALFSMIPIAGAVVVWGIGVIYLLLTSHWGSALFLLVYGTLVISMADNIVRPLVLSGRVKLNTLMVLFSLLGGVQAFGIVGLFVGPVVVSVAIALVRMLSEMREDYRAT